MKILKLEEEFHVSVETFFTFFFESSGFKQRYHSTRGDTQIEVKPWTPSNDGKYKREINFFSSISSSPYINKMVGENAKVREVQHYKFSEDRTLSVTAETFFDGSPIGKSFTSESEWVVRPSNNNKVAGCKVSITVKNNYTGSIVVKYPLEIWVHDTTEQSFKHWLSLVRSQVEEYELSENLKRVTPTPQKEKERDSPKQTLQQQPIKHILNSFKDNNNHNINKNNDEIDQDGEELDEDDEIDENQQYNRSLHSNINDNVSDVSDFSKDIHEDFTDEEFESNEEFYDTNEAWSSAPSINGSNSRKEIKIFINSFQNELGSMKSVLEVNHNRLLSLESAFTNLLQQSSNSRILLGSNGLKTSIVNNSNGGVNTNNHESIPSGLAIYLSKIDELIKSQQDDESRSLEKEKENEQRFLELENKINQLSASSSKTSLWFNIIGLLVFLIGWPILARKIYSTLLPIILNLLKK